MDAIAVLGIIGGVALLVAFYGGLDADRIRIPPLPRGVRIASGVIGGGLIFFVMWVIYRQSLQVQVQSVIDTLPITQVAPNASAPAIDSTPVGCSELILTSINPGSLLEENHRIYKLFGSGFCSDTLISISGGAFVGNDPKQAPNGQPIEVSPDGTWLTVDILPVASPNETGQTITVHNPDGNQATLFVNFQR